MNLRSIQEQVGYLEAHLEGPFVGSKLEAVIDSIGSVLVEKGGRHLLLNTQAMTGKGPSFMERYQVGMVMLRLPKGVRVATLSRAEWIDPEQFGLRVAQNRGAEASVFSDRAQAVAWLLGDSTKAPPPV